MNFLLQITENDYSSNLIQSKGFIETLGFGAQMLFLGMATVFSVLAIIWVCLTIFKFAFQEKPKSAKKVAEEAPAVVDVAPVVASNQDEEIVAVIAAAIAMAESENAGLKFKVVSFKRK